LQDLGEHGLHGQDRLLQDVERFLRLLQLLLLLLEILVLDGLLEFTHAFLGVAEALRSQRGGVLLLEGLPQTARRLDVGPGAFGHQTDEHQGDEPRPQPVYGASRADEPPCRFPCALSSAS
jgi:hypothetical protein